MNDLLAAAGAAVWLGILTSISPCPLATNIAAISFIGRTVKRPSATLLSGASYTLGRTLTYCVLGLILVASSQAVPAVSMFLQAKMKVVMGPFLVIIGVVLLDVIKIAFPGATLPDTVQQRLGRSGPLGAFALGVVFALSFCPVSAALFFGSTFGLAAAHGSRFLIPSLYGIGTAAPVVGFAFVVAFSAHAVGALFQKVTVFEKWARRISGMVFIVAGLHTVLSVNFHLY
jgi:cytochrome c-type biogenesis protein